MRPFLYSALDPRGPQAGVEFGLTKVLIVITVLVWIAVMVVLAAAFMRRRQVPSEGVLTLRTGLATAATVIIVSGLLITSILTGNSLSDLPPQAALDLEITGHQWWWDVNYMTSPASEIVRTANEIHVPAGRPIRLKVTSSDVIHSFWVPNLRGKIDMIPSRVNTTWFQADHPGTYRGQCAEFCGFQHAHMALLVIAEPEDVFNKWYEAQKANAHEGPEDGKAVFLKSPCVVCHTIRGTPAAGRVGPDLTHLASRRTIAAGTLANNRGNLAGWIVDAQQIKPGTQMPPMSLQSQDIEPLLDYLESLR